MRQRHTQDELRHSEDQQNTGNHPKPGTKQEHGADQFGGTRKGAENVEDKSAEKSGS